MDITGYKKTVLATTDRVQIILMLYEGILNHIKIAKQKVERGDVLSNILDMEKGGEISQNLRSLYTYVVQRLIYANLNNDLTALEEAEKVIGTIKDGWKEMMKEFKQQQVPTAV